MKNIEPTDDLPEHAKLALEAMAHYDAVYCDKCDGLRLKEHTCVCCVCGSVEPLCTLCITSLYFMYKGK